MTREPTEMELRVANALNDAEFDEWPVGPHQINLARAAIRAMREPTKEMIALGNDKIEYDLDHGYPSTGPSVEILTTSARDAWNAMIDAASPLDTPPR